MQFIGIIAIIIIGIVLGFLLRIFFHKSEEYEGRHTYPVIDQSGIVTYQSDDTEQMSSFDRQAYIESQERLADTAEHELFLQSDEVWTKEIRAIFAEALAIDQMLERGDVYAMVYQAGMGIA